MEEAEWEAEIAADMAKPEFPLLKAAMEAHQEWCEQLKINYCKKDERIAHIYASALCAQVDRSKFNPKADPTGKLLKEATIGVELWEEKLCLQQKYPHLLTAASMSVSSSSSSLSSNMSEVERSNFILRKIEGWKKRREEALREEPEKEDLELGPFVDMTSPEFLHYRAFRDEYQKWINRFEVNRRGDELQIMSNFFTALFFGLPFPNSLLQQDPTGKFFKEATTKLAFEKKLNDYRSKYPHFQFAHSYLNAAKLEKYCGHSLIFP